MIAVIAYLAGVVSGALIAWAWRAGAVHDAYQRGRDDVARERIEQEAQRAEIRRWYS